MNSVETLYFLQGHYLRDTQISLLVASFINANKDPKKGKAIECSDISVFKTPKKKEKQDAKEQRQILEVFTIAMGGEVIRNG